MAYTPVTIDRFGGLDLRADPQEIGQGRAADLANVLFTQDGRLVTRDGYTKPYSGGPTAITNLWPYPAEGVLASFTADSVKALNLTTGAVIATVALTSPVSSFATAGTAGATYFTDGSTTQIRKWSGGAFTSPAALAGVKGTHVAIQPLDDRLVVVDASNTSRLLFSAVGLPEDFSGGFSIKLTEGDGQEITALATFGTLLFAFKRTKFFVFYGNSTLTDGTPVFNYRMVDTGVGCWQGTGETWRLTAKHPSGLYFVANDGVYRTVGDTPVRVSDPIGPLFKGANIPIPATFTMDTTPQALWGFLGIAADRLYLCSVLGGTNGVYFLDLHTGDWGVHNFPTTGASALLDGSLIASTLDTAGYRGAWVIGMGPDVALSNRALTTDNGSAIAWKYQSGYAAPANDSRVVMRESSIFGSGTVTHQVVAQGARPNDVADTGSAVTLGTAPAVAEGRRRRGVRGVFFANKVSGSGPAVVSRITNRYRQPESDT